VDILAEIVEKTKEIVAERRARLPLEHLRDRVRDLPRTPKSLSALLEEKRPHVIAEFKRRSPSKPSINPDADPVEVARAYEAGGASAMSVLTEPAYFGGTPADLEAVRAAVSMPLLRKDFLVDPYQIYEARAMGADLVLLIARCLSPAQLADYCLLAQELGMEVLCEIHGLDELEIVGDAPIDFLGVNCRDLKKFDTDIDRLVTLAAQVPDHLPLVAESGIHSREDLWKLYRHGYSLFLIGEFLMKSDRADATLQALLRP